MIHSGIYIIENLIKQKRKKVCVLDPKIQCTDEPIQKKQEEKLVKRKKKSKGILY